MLPLMMRVLVLPLLLSLGQAAPKDGATSFSSSVLLYLFALHDYDQNGQLDGLELLSMLTAALTPGAADSSPTNPVILVVDKVLETQDLNGDGLMTPAEIINFPGETTKESLAPAPQGPHATGRQPLLPKSPLGQEMLEAISLREAREQVEARRESLEPVQEAGAPAKPAAEAPGPEGEAGGQAEAEEEAPGPGGEFGGQAEAEREAPGPTVEVGGQAEARGTAEEAEALPRETLASKNTPQQFEVHSIQLENDEI
ncbi:cell growth regulator with EF hand domain protein 1 isoform 2-T3 [Dugong dugon]